MNSGSSAEDVVKAFGLHITTGAKWVRLSPMGMPTATLLSESSVQQRPLNPAERLELVESGRRLRQVQMERDILARLWRGLREKARRRLRAHQSKPGRSLAVRTLLETLAGRSWHSGRADDAPVDAGQAVLPEAGQRRIYCRP